MAPERLASATVVLAGTGTWADAVASALAPTGADLRREPSVDGADAAVAAGGVDAVVTALDLDDGTGIEVTEAVRQRSETLPVVVVTAAGDERAAAGALAAGATEYVPLESPGAVPATRLRDRLAAAVRAADRRRGERERGRQFEAVYRNTQSPTWILDGAGRLRGANETAAAMVEADPADLEGEDFWTLPWWAGAEQVRADIEQVLETIRERRGTQRLVTADGGAETIELSFLPVTDESGELGGVVVEGNDVTERVTLYRELQSSEELHRVTLNNMTDTVLVTDEDGAFTYVCPNVHFIFGYTAEEIRDLGTIDALLGADLFDRETLAAEGVLKNIECTVRDKAGREHTLLVNVREVSIQDGTLLYSCRDITKRKQRERALTTLQGTARAFLYAETREEIAQHIVEDVPAVLGVDASAVVLFDPEDNELQPVAQSEAFERLNGPVPALSADGGTIAGHSFVADESLFFADVHGDDRLANPATDLRSAAYIPLGDHGVFLAGTNEVGQFDDLTQELADLLAATAEAALDRVRRESRLRDQERELQRQNRELSTLNRINEIIREIDQALVRAETREEIEHAVCARLTEESRFTFAWIGDVDPTSGRLEARAWAGDGQGYLDAVTVPVGAQSPEAAGRTAATGEVTAVPKVPEGLREEAWRTEALARDFLSVLSVPIAYDEFTYGVLTVYADTRNAFEDTAEAVLEELGETVASAISAIERKNALLTTSMTRVEFDVADPSFVLERLAAAADCTLSYRGGVQQTAGGIALFVTVEEGAVADVTAAAGDLVALEAATRTSASVLRLELSGPFIALELADHGAVLRSADVDPTGSTLVIDVPDSIDVRHITRLVSETFADVDLRSKHTVEAATTPDLHARVRDDLTDRQREVVKTAYFSGYFESPRESSGEDVAELLGISPTAFYQHTRKVQRTLFSTLFEDVSGGPVERE